MRKRRRGGGSSVFSLSSLQSFILLLLGMFEVKCVDKFASEVSASEDKKFIK